jgi:hypothetical protein
LTRKLNQHPYEWVKKPNFLGMTEAERAAVAERLREKERERALCLRAEGHRNAQLDTVASLLDFYPKQGYNRYTFIDLPTFNFDEKCKSSSLIGVHACIIWHGIS